MAGNSRTDYRKGEPLAARDINTLARNVRELKQGPDDLSRGPIPRGQMFVPVELSSDGGSNGTGTAAPTFTYTLTDLYTGKTLASSILPSQQFSFGAHLEATIGMAFWHFGLQEWKLWWCDQVLETEACD